MPKWEVKDLQGVWGTGKGDIQSVSRSSVASKGAQDSGVAIERELYSILLMLSFLT